MGSKYMLAEGTTLQMSKEEVKDTSGNIATGATPVTYVDLADTTKTIDYSGESTAGFGRLQRNGAGID